MPRKNFDVIVVGLGAIGSATLCHLARDGKRVLGIDRFSPPHDRGSSHGRTRIYRQAYYEAPAYVPLARRALELWSELERDTARTLFTCTGALTIGPEHGELVAGVLRSVGEHDIPHSVLTSDEVRARFPVFRPPEGTIGVFEPTGGVLFPEVCIDAHLDAARAAGATIVLNDPVQSVGAVNGKVTVATQRAAYETERAVVSAGAWGPQLAGLGHAFRVTRETVHWFAPASPRAAARDCPVSMIAFDDGPILYSIPDFGDGFKAGLHHAGHVADPMDDPVIPADAARDVEAALKLYAPGGAGQLITSAPCYYTTSPDHHFVIGPLPSMPEIILASACSGHGFKFASALGECVARMCAGRDSGLPAELFDVARLSA